MEHIRLLRRRASIERVTTETSIQLHLELPAVPLAGDSAVDQLPTKAAPSEPHSSIDTGIGFLDHMLQALSKHAGWQLVVKCKGDLHVDDHHTVEDVALCLGRAFRTAVGLDQPDGCGMRGIRRFGYAYAPLDEALARSVVDLSNRPHASIDLQLRRERLGQLSTEMLAHFLKSFAMSAQITLHVDVLRGENDHHRAESAFKSLALALRSACESLSGTQSTMIMSTKGVL